MKMLIRKEDPNNQAHTQRVAVVDIPDNTTAAAQASAAIRAYSAQQGGDFAEGVYQVEQLAAVTRYRNVMRRSSSLSTEAPIS